MKLNYYLKRIINNKLKLMVILLIIIYPIIEVCRSLEDISRGGSVFEPNLMSFLRGTYSSAFGLLVWYLPLYLLLIVADDCIEDYKFGYKNLLVTQWGKRTYLRTNVAKGFILGFSVIFIALAINFIMTQIAFAGGSYTGFNPKDMEWDETLKPIFQNPMLTNIKYILITSFISGIVGMGASAVAIALHNRLLVYPVVFIIWYIPFAIEKSIILAIQPFTEYLLKDVYSTVLLVIAINVAAVIFAYVKEIKYEKV